MQGQVQETLIVACSTSVGIENGWYDCSCVNKSPKLDTDEIDK